MQQSYPIGVPGQVWNSQHKKQWFEQQAIKRSYKQEVLSKIAGLHSLFEVIQYGALPYDTDKYPLFILKSSDWQVERPTVLITGGVHGYETSGVQGALRFAETVASKYVQQVNFLIAPCLSPWGYETINRWNPDAIDPNRSFYANSPAAEPRLLMEYLQSLNIELTAHFDLHETTDTDNSEFGPALAARDGVENEEWEIPDGFYTVGNSQHPQPEFQQAVIAAVEKVTHIAPADKWGKIIGTPQEQKGVINYDMAKLGLCGGFSNATYVTTTEVYPDSPSANDEICIQAQVAAITGGLDYILA